MTSIYHHSKEAAAEARLARMNQPAVTAVDAKAQYERVVNGSNGDESMGWTDHILSKIDCGAIILPKSTNSSRWDGDWRI